MRIFFIIPGEPSSKGRPRFYHNGKFVRAYTPSDTVNYENLVRLAWMQREESGDIRKLTGAIKAEIWAYFPIPKSASKKKQAQMMQDEIRPITVKKDMDNICKVILDALNGIAYDDDRQIVDLIASKHYSDRPRAEVVLEEV